MDSYRHLNVFVQWNQEQADEAPVDLGVVSAVDAQGATGARRHANLQENLAGPQGTDMISVSGAGSWHAMGPFAQVFVHNEAPLERAVSVWGYLCS